MYPRLNIDLTKLKHNANTLCCMAQKQGICDLAFVTKVFCADTEMVKALAETPCRYLADSRIENLANYPETDKQKILLRLPMLSQAEDVVKYSDISFNSEKATLCALSAAAQKLGKQHQVVLMIDMGDLREGIFFENEDEILQLAEFVENDPHLTLYGTAFNLTCYGSVLPTEENLSQFLRITEKIEEKIARKLEFVSGGNSSSVSCLLLNSAQMRFNNLRLGEALVLGRETAHEQDLDGMYQDAVTLEVELIEIQDKPSYPIGEIGVNAFGEKMEYTDLGIRRRAIAAIGRQDMDCDGLTPLDSGVTVVGASSDHLILDITDNGDKLQVGSVLHFKMNYGGVLRGFTSNYVNRAYTPAEYNANNK